MKAAVVTDFTQPLEIQDRPVPEPGPGQVLVRIEACGLCHTDIHAAHGDWPVKPTPPFVPGHEGVGIVEEVGAGVTARRSATGSPSRGSATHAAAATTASAAGRRCASSSRTAATRIDGAFAEYAVADADFVVPVPDGVSSFDAAPLTCAGVTTYKAIKVAHIRPAEKVAIFGVGGLGHLAVQYARLVGGDRRRCRRRRTTSSSWRGARGRPRRERRDDRPGRRNRRAGRSRRGGRARRDPGGLRAGLRLAASRWPAGLRRPSARDRRPDEPADLPDRAQGHLGDRLDRRHPSGPGRGLRAARPGTDQGHRREPQARRGQRVDRRRARRAAPRRGWSSSSEHPMAHSAPAPEAGSWIDLYWLPLGAGGRVVPSAAGRSRH